MERQLASLQEIVEILPIEGADKIELVKVLGWQCVTQKENNFVKGSRVVYFEIDSLLPASPIFEFLRKKPEETQFRLKTIRLRGHYSQGLVLPEDTFVEHPRFQEIFSASPGDDLTEVLGIEKYEPEIPAQLRGIVAGNFPSFVNKTDETRIQAYPQLLELKKGTEGRFTEKLDGSSITVFYVQRNTPGIPSKFLEISEDDYILGVCSRKLPVLPSEDNAFWKAVNATGLPAKLKEYGKPIVLQGELVGPGIQKNKLQLKDVEIYWYNIADPITRKHYDFTEFSTIAYDLKLKVVPILEIAPLNYTVEELVAKSIGNSVLNPQIKREGIVWRPSVEEEVHRFGRLSFKVINPEFLVKFNE